MAGTLDLATLLLRLKADAGQYKTEVGGAKATTQKAGLDIKNVLAGAVAGGFAAATAAAVAFANDSVKEFQKFDTQMREVFTLLPDISQGAMGELQDQALQAATSMGRLPEEVVPALYQALSAGVPQGNVFEFLEVANQAALGGVTTLETAVDGITSVVNAYGADVINAGQASDLMFAAVRGGKTTFDELAGSLFQVIPTASALGIEFGNVTAALATMTAAGTPTAVATTQLRQLLVELSKEGSKAAGIFEEMAGKSFAEFMASGGNLQQVLQLMDQAAADSGVSLSDLFSSVEAGNAALGLTGANTQKFTTELNNATMAAGGTEDAAARFGGSLEQAERLAAAATGELKILIGEALAPAKIAWMELRAEIAKAASEHVRHSNAVNAGQDSRDALVEQLKEAATETEGLISVNGGAVDSWDAINLALIELSKTYPSQNGNLEEMETNMRAVEAMTQLLNDGFQGNGRELAAAAIETVRLADEQARLAIETEQMAAVTEYMSDARRFDTEGIEQNAAALTEQIEVVAAATVVNQDLADKTAQLAAQQAAADPAIQAANLALRQQQEAATFAYEATVQYEQFLSTSFVTALTNSGGAETNWRNELFTSAAQMGLNATQLGLLAAATGEYTEEEIRAALEAAVMKQKVEELALAVSSNNMTVGQALVELDNFQNSLGETGTQAGAAQEKIDQYVGSLEGIPAEVSTTVTANTASAEDAISRLERRLSDLGSAPTGTGTPDPYAGGGNIPGNALGTDYFGGGWTWVGEDGPELLNLPSGSEIASNRESMAMMGGASYVINVDARGSNLSERQIEAAVERGLKQAGVEADAIRRMGG